MLLVGPGFRNTDLSLMKNARIGARASLQFRLDVFDLFNTPTLVRRATSSAARRSARSRERASPTGEAGSSRQMQLAARLSF